MTCFGCGAETKTYVGAVPICVLCAEKSCYGGRKPQELSPHESALCAQSDLPRLEKTF